MKKILFSILCMMVSGIVTAQTFYYVSPEGKDKNPGTIKAPFKTIEKAQLKARQTKEDVIICLREGVYRLTETLVFTPQDGNAHKNLTIRPYSHEKVVITSGTLLTPEWKPYRNGIMKADIKKGLNMDMLCVDDDIRYQARYPDYDSTAIRFNGVAADATSPERVRKWAHPEDGFLHAMHMHDWGDFQALKTIRFATLPSRTLSLPRRYVHSWKNMNLCYAPTGPSTVEELLFLKEQNTVLSKTAIYIISAATRCFSLTTTDTLPY